METGFEANDKTSFFDRIWRLFLALFLKFKSSVVDTLNNVKKLGKDDPRRIAHSIKVALALTLVSLFYYFRPLYDGVGGNSIWAVLTVVVVFEYSVGATLCKCLNRGLATLLAGFIAVGVHYVATVSGKKGEPVILALSVFLLAAGSTFSRFFPGIKARYDYGVVVFILTFSLVAVSGYRVDKLFELAHQRLTTIAIGCCLCLIISMLICPVWAGKDLHNLVALNIEKLADSLEGFIDEYFKDEEEGNNGEVKQDKAFAEGCKNVLNSKSTEESLANFARWEPAHGRFGFRHPWKQYKKIGTMTRHCAYCVEALNAAMNSEFKGPEEFRRRIRPPCLKMSSETSKGLREIADRIRTMMTTPVPSDGLLAGAKTAIEELKTALKTTSHPEYQIPALLTLLPMATIASLLVEIIDRAENLAVAVDELATLSRFDNIPQGKHHGAAVKPAPNTSDVVITVFPPTTLETPRTLDQMRALHVDL